MKGPIGACRYCGQEFMSKQYLKVHEQKSCPERPSEELEKPVQRPAHFRPRHTIGGVTVWTRDGDERF